MKVTSVTPSTAGSSTDRSEQSIEIKPIRAAYLGDGDNSELVGKWIVDKSRKVVGDKAERQIQEAIHQFVKLAEREGGWTTLYRSSFDNSYWERTYAQSELHGGGPSKLTRLRAEQVAERYLVLNLP